MASPFAKGAAMNLHLSLPAGLKLPAPHNRAETDHVRQAVSHPSGMLVRNKTHASGLALQDP